MNRRFQLKALVSALAVGLLSPISPAAANAATSPDTATCRDADIPVSLPVGSATMHGRLCLPPGAVPSTVMVMVPGASYNSTYWDFPYRPELYSFRRAMNRAGYATFTLDRLGTGRSSRPISGQLTSLTQATAVHQVIQALRAGKVAGTAFRKAVILGHSLGSGISVMEAATFRDVDAAVLTGMSHHPQHVNLVSLFTDSFRPAYQDPQIGARGYDPGYLTSLPHTRYADFHTPAKVDPKMLAVDEATKDVLTATEAADSVAISATTPYTSRINVPVLMAVGSRDNLFCGSLAADCSTRASLLKGERPYFAGTPCLSAVVLPGAGHDINLHPRTAEYQSSVRKWADAVLGRNPGTVTPPAGAC